MVRFNRKLQGKWSARENVSCTARLTVPGRNRLCCQAWSRGSPPWALMEAEAQGAEGFALSLLHSWEAAISIGWS